MLPPPVGKPRDDLPPPGYKLTSRGEYRDIDKRRGGWIIWVYTNKDGDKWGFRKYDPFMKPCIYDQFFSWD